MRNVIALAIVVASSFGLLFAKPMEALSRYNVVLVHGAAPESQGFGNQCGETVSSAWEFHNNWVLDYTTQEGKRKAPKSFGDAAGMLGAYNQDGDTKLTLWLDSAVFEDTVTYGSEYIYIQRSFANPAASPAHNAHEIGDRTWLGDGGCSVRRALFEEAQEVRAEGSTNLGNKRNDSKLSYRSIPSRNILIAHSMGGVASHEYVTDASVYNDDVDKVITLDSPHRGTYSLDGLLDMKHYIASTSVEVVAQMSLLYGSALVLGYGGFAVNQTALIAITYGFISLNALNTFVDAVVDLALGYDFTEADPLASYIVPGSADLKEMNERPWNERTPMFRLLYGVGGLTFGSNEEYLQDFGSLVVPDGLFAMVKNIIAQASHTEFDGNAYANNIIAGGTLGLVGGLGLTDHGSILIPHWSGAGEDVTVFESENADVMRVPFAANLHTDQSNKGLKVLGLVAAGSAALIGCEGLNVFSPAAVKAAKTAIGISTGVALASWILPPTIEAIKDMKENHDNAKARRMLDTLYSADFSYTKVGGGDVSGKTRLMEFAGGFLFYPTTCVGGVAAFLYLPGSKK